MKDVAWHGGSAGDGKGVRLGPGPVELGRRPEPVEAFLWYVPGEHGVHAEAPAKSRPAKPMPRSLSGEFNEYETRHDRSFTRNDIGDIVSKIKYLAAVTSC